MKEFYSPNIINAVKEIEVSVTMLRNNLNETEKQLIARFVQGLKSKFYEKLIMQPQFSLMDTIRVADLLDRRLKNSGNLHSESFEVSYFFFSFYPSFRRFIQHHFLPQQSIPLSINLLSTSITRFNKMREKGSPYPLPTPKGPCEGAFNWNGCWSYVNLNYQDEMVRKIKMYYFGGENKLRSLSYSIHNVFIHLIWV